MPTTPSARQRAAIEAPLGPTLVVAGPGAGKTFCLIERVGYLIAHHRIDPERILAVTFTNKAAEEIAGRLQGTLGSRAEVVHRGTLHALCAQLLRERGSAIGVEPGFGIADEIYQDLTLKRLGVWHKRIGQYLTLFSRRKLVGYQLADRDERVFERYVAHLKRRNMLDFDDLIAKVADLFAKQPAIAREIAGRWDYVLVDEFQDLDATQYAIIKALGVAHRGLFAVGDDEQSIFAFRGAQPQVLKRFAQDFGAEPIVLDKNRRCSVQIFETARRLLFANEPLFAQKDITADRTSEHDVIAMQFDDETDEADWIVADLGADRARTGRDWGAYALLYRRHSTGNVLEGRLINEGVPCRLARGRALRDDPAIRFVVTALRYLRSPDDPLLVEGIADLLLPDTLVGEVRRHAKEHGQDFLQAVETLARAKPQRDPDRAKLWRFFYDVENLRSLQRFHDDLMAIVEELLSRRIGEYRNVLEERHDDLTDPEQLPEAVALAERLQPVLDGRGAVGVPPAGGVGIALKGMLLAGGVTVVDWVSGVGGQGPGGVHVGPRVPDPGHPTPDTPAIDTDPLTLFKALQLIHARGLGARLENYTTFDLETTDLDVRHCEIVEIAAVRVRNGEVVDRFHSPVRPSRPISAKAAETHGYSDDDVRDAPSFRDAWPRFRAFVARDLLVAHNGLNFDVPVLDRMVNALGDIEEYAHFRDLVFFDTAPLARDLVHGSAKLEVLAEGFDIPTGRAHHALDDCITLARVFGELETLKAARVRKTALVGLLDWLAVGLALQGPGVRARVSGTTVESAAPDTRDLEPDTSRAERATLFKLGRIRPLGPYSDVLEQYEAERAALRDDTIPTLDSLIDRLGGRRFMARLRKEKRAEQRYPESVARLRAIVAAATGATLEERIDRFLELVALTTSDGPDVARHKVNLLTLHSTKGLEFPGVYIVGVEDDEFLLRREDGTAPPKQELEEARRLLYVGMTRAEDRLVLTWAGRRNGWTKGGRRFLEEMGLTATTPLNAF